MLIAALWLGGMGFLMKREYFRPSAQLLAEAAHLDEAADPPHALRALGVRAGFDHPAGRDHGRGRPGIVPEEPLVESEAGAPHQ